MYAEIERGAIELRARVGASSPLLRPRRSTPRAPPGSARGALRPERSAALLRGPDRQPEGSRLRQRVAGRRGVHRLGRGAIRAPASSTVRAVSRTSTTPCSRSWNERGGETNVSTGWHAIEFLLWGQDFDGPDPGASAHRLRRRHRRQRGAARRVPAAGDRSVGASISASCPAAWAAEPGNYRTAFEAGIPIRALRRILTGMLILSGFEMAGERLAVAYETKDQEQEHSCFSDTTHLRPRGERARHRGDLPRRRQDSAGPASDDLARAVDAALADELDGEARAALAALARHSRAVRPGDAGRRRRPGPASRAAASRRWKRRPRDRVAGRRARFPDGDRAGRMSDRAPRVRSLVLRDGDRAAARRRGAGASVAPLPRRTGRLRDDAATRASTRSGSRARALGRRSAARSPSATRSSSRTG